MHITKSSCAVIAETTFLGHLRQLLAMLPLN